MDRYKAIIAYDGSAYCGFQRQLPQFSTIQGTLEETIAAIVKQPCTLYGAGRTDSGVHASGQVISFDLNWNHSSQALLKAINVNLPVDIAVRQLEKCGPKFHPRYDAVRREYVYSIHTEAVRNPLQHRYSWYVPHRLDMAQMNEAAEKLIGEHDFATFGQPPKGNNTQRTLFKAYWEQDDTKYNFTIQGNAFLYRMVRRIVSMLKRVGEGKMSPARFDEILKAKDVGLASPPAPACGLVLSSVWYD